MSSIPNDVESSHKFSYLTGRHLKSFSIGELSFVSKDVRVSLAVTEWTVLQGISQKKKTTQELARTTKTVSAYRRYMYKDSDEKWISHI